MEIVAGQQIKGYEIQERIAAGGFGAVYRAYQSTVGREVAIKIILPGLANQPDFIRRFESEAQVVARLEHMNIVPLYDYWRDPDGAYLVMRYLRGGSLYDYIKKQGKLDIEETFRLLAQIAQGLHVAHRNQIIHRDIKPGNVLLDEDGNGYLGDFGIAKDYQATHSLTEPDHLMGSPEYLAPEQARSESVTPQTDIYSLGVVLYEMLTGEHPFPGVDKITYIYKHLSDPLPYVTTLDDPIQDGVNQVIQKATAKDPRQRFQDVIELVEALRQATRLDAAPTPIRIVELLTPREQEVMQLIIDGKTNREIAGILVITEGTVKQYISSIYRKLKVRSRVQAIARARDFDFVIKKPQGLTTSVTEYLPEPQNPYKGLRAFEAGDNQNYFGRENLTQKLLDRLKEPVPYQRFLAVVGPSGSGKSSVIKAGVIPALWRGDVQGSENWYVIDILPGSNPIDELEIALFQIATDKSLNLREQLMRDERGLVRVGNMILPDQDSELVIIIDQFEEVFTLVDNEDKRLHFIKLLRTAITESRSKVRVIVTLRADYYDKPLQYAELGDLMRDRVETVLPLSAEELERAIREPAILQDVYFEDGLISKIVSDVNYQPGALPLLQYALTELFERRDGRKLTLEAYDAIGGAGGALANRADEIYLEQDETGQEMIRQLFLRLVTLGEGAEDTRRRVERLELLSLVSDRDRMDEIIDAYAQSRLFSLDTDLFTRHPTVEVAHEAILREWERLRQWLNESREDIRQERVVARAATEWEATLRDASYLLTGSRLEQVENWYQSSLLKLTPTEQEYIQASLQERNKQQREDMERKARELGLEQRAMNRLRALVGVFAVAATVAFILLALLFNAFGDIEVERNNAQRVSLAAQGQIILQNGRPAEQAALLALKSLEIDYSPEADAVLQTALQRGFALQEYIGHGDAIRNIEVSSDGLRLISFSEDQTARLWDIVSGQEILQVNHGTPINVGRWSSSGQYIATSGTDGQAIVWDAVTGEKDQTVSHGTGFVWVGLFSPTNPYFLTAINDSFVHMWNIETGELVRTFEAPGTQIGETKFSPDGRYVVGAGSQAVLWDVETGEVVRRFFGHSDFIIDVAFSLDGRRIVTASRDKTARVWDVATGHEIRRFDGHTDFVRSAVFSPNGRYILTGSDDGTARRWYIETGEELNRFELSGTVNAARFLPSGTHVVTAGSDRIIRLWQLNPQAEPLVFAEEFNSSKRGEISLDAELLSNDLLLTSGANAGIRFWRRVGDIFEIDSEMLYGDQVVDAIIYRPETRKVVTASNTGVLQLWDAETGGLELGFAGHATGTILNLDFSSDGEKLASAGSDGIVHVWETNFARELTTLTGHIGAVYVARFSPDGRMIATGGSDSTVRLWDADSGAEIGQLNEHDSIVRDLDFSPDGKQLVSVSHDSRALLWDVDTGALIRQFTGHTDQVWRVRFSPDGRQILTGSADLTARVWDVETGEIVRQLVGHKNSIQSVRFSPDASLIVTGDDQAAYLWRADLNEVITFACSLIPRDFTGAERELYGLTDANAVCDTDAVTSTNQVDEEIWTPHPPLPTAVPLVLSAMGEDIVTKFDFFPVPVAAIEGMKVPAFDVHILTEDGMVVRPTSLDDDVLNAPLYATRKAIPMDFIVPPYDAGPYDQGLPLGFTMAEWIAASGKATYSVGINGAVLKMEFENLRPNAVYTAWCARVNLPENAISDAPCGKIDGSNNAFTSGEDGSGAITIELEEPFLPSTQDLRTVIAIAYHSDGRTYGFYSGDLGRITHQQLVYEFPFE